MSGALVFSLLGGRTVGVLVCKTIGCFKPVVQSGFVYRSFVAKYIMFWLLPSGMYGYLHMCVTSFIPPFTIGGFPVGHRLWKFSSRTS